MVRSHRDASSNGALLRKQAPPVAWESGEAWILRAQERYETSKTRSREAAQQIPRQVRRQADLRRL